MREKELFSVSFESVSSMRARGVFADPYCLLKFLSFMGCHSLHVMGRSEYIMGVVSAMLESGIEVNLLDDRVLRPGNALLWSCDEYFEAGLTRLLLSHGGRFCGDAVDRGYEGRLRCSCDDIPELPVVLGLVERLRSGETGVILELERIHFRKIVYIASTYHLGSLYGGAGEVSLCRLISSGLSSLGDILLGYSPGLESYAGYVRNCLKHAIERSRLLLLGESRSRQRGCVKFVQHSRKNKSNRYVYCANSSLPVLWVRRTLDGKYVLRTCGGEPDRGVETCRILNAVRDGRFVFYDRVEWADTECGRMVIRCYVGDECDEITLLESRREDSEVESYWCGAEGWRGRAFPGSREFRVRYAGSFGESIESMESRGVCTNPLCMLDYFQLLGNCRFDVGVGVEQMLGVIDYFLSKGIDVNAVDRRGATVLKWVLHLGCSHFVFGRRPAMSESDVSLLLRKLLSCGASLEGEIGEKLLEESCDSGLLCVIRVLLEYGVEMSFRHLSWFFCGCTHVWRLCSCIEMLELYRSHGLPLSSSELTKLLYQVSEYAEVDGRYVGDFSVEFLSKQRELIISVLSCEGAHEIDWLGYYSGHSLLSEVRSIGNESLYKWLLVILESSYKRYVHTKPSCYSLLLVRPKAGSSVSRSYVTKKCLPVDSDNHLDISSFASDGDRDAWISRRAGLGIGEDELVYVSPFMFGELLCEFVDAELCRLLELPFGSAFVMNGIRIDITPVASDSYDYTYRALSATASSVTCTSVPSISALRVDFLRLCTSSFLSHLSTYPFEVA